MTTKAPTKTTQDQVAEMEYEGQGQQASTPEPEIAHKTDHVTDQEIDTAGVGLEDVASPGAAPARRRPPASPTAKR
jgi:hypothetical protein